MSNARFYKVAEKALYEYQQNKRIVEEYESCCMRIVRPQREEGGRSPYISDPTARGAIKLIEKPYEVKQAALWAWAVENAWAEMEAYAPNKSRLMEVYYGLNNPLGRERKAATATRYRLQEELAIEKSTFYQWKNDVVESVIYIALWVGLLTPHYKTKPPA